MQPSGPLLDDPTLFTEIISLLRESGYAEDDIHWSENCGLPSSAEEFAREAIFVICNSGMRATIARDIFRKCCGAIEAGESTSTVFGHKGKASAIDQIWRDRQAFFAGYMEAQDKIEYCRSLPWIGGITCYHLAKSFGEQVAKPDVHLVRLADRHAMTPQELCEALAERTGLKVNTVDLLLWRACAESILDGHTCQLIEPPKEPDPAPQQVELFEPVQGDFFAH